MDLAVDLTADEPASEVVLSLLIPTRQRTLAVGGGLGSDLDRMATSWAFLAELETGAKSSRPGATLVGIADLSEDPVGDVLGQAASMDVDVIVVPSRSGDDGPAAALLAASPVSVVVVSNAVPGAAHGRTVEIAEGGRTLDEEAATEVAIRLARAGGAPIRFAPGSGGRSAELAGLVRRTGLTVDDGPSATGDALSVAAVGTPDRAGSTSLRVQAGADRIPADLRRLVRRLERTSGDG